MKTTRPETAPADPPLLPPAPSEAELAALRAVVPAPEPADFADFWRETCAEARAIQPEPRLQPSALTVEGFDVCEFTCQALGPRPIRGWLSVPRGRPVRRGLVVSHGYNGREGPDTLPLLPDAAMIFPCARGLSLSIQPDLPAVSTGHVLHGIASRDTYIHRGCAADIWAAASTLLELYPAAAARLDYVGTSFGGGIGALSLPWDERFASAFLGLPSFGQHLLRLQTPCIGSGEAVRLYAAAHPEVVDVLRYFDASVAAGHLRISTLVAAAVFDPAVPPVGQFAIYNALPGPKELLPLRAGHFDWPGAAAEEAAIRAAITRFLS